MSDFFGLPTATLSNDHLRLDYLTEAGPRIVRLFMAGSVQNLLAEVPHMSQETVHGTYYFRGGHRLWHAPETGVRTYIPDNEGLEVIPTADNSVTLQQPTEVATGIGKTMVITLAAEKAAVTVAHHLCNDGVWPVQLAPWAVTQLRPGGVAVLPQQVGALDEEGYLPNRQLVLWPYTRWQDARLQLAEDYLFVQASQETAPLKIGYLNRQGWMGYIWQDIYFGKHFTPDPAQPHADMGCNAEVYTCDKFIELETLAPLQTIEPGETITHEETWVLHQGFTPPQTLAEVRAVMASIQS